MRSTEDDPTLIMMVTYLMIINMMMMRMRWGGGVGVKVLTFHQ